MSEPRKDPSEPSMEEILSSIRKIIAEEEDGAATRLADAPRAPAAAARDDDILELTERVDDAPPAAGRTRPADDLDTIPPAPARPAPPAPRAVPVETDVQKTPSFAETPPTAPVPPKAPTRPSPAEASMTEQLVSTDAASLSTAALAKLARVAVPATAPAQLPSGGITVEQLVVDLLKPMLKDWLDRNLPAVVERIVEEEVKKLVRRAELS